MLLPAPYDIFIQRGIAFGPLDITVYSDLAPLNTPVAPTVATQGTAGATTWAYLVVARNTNTLQFSAAGSATTITTGNATLDGTNYNRITWTAVDGANQYQIYRTTAGGTPSTTGLIVTTANLSFNDTGTAGDGTTAPSVGGPGTVVDLTGYTPHAHARRDPPDTVLENLSPIITNFPGGVIEIGKFTDEQTLNFKKIVNGKWSLVLENSSGDWLPPIIAGAYTVVDSVTRNAPSVPPPFPPPTPSPTLAYLNLSNTFTETNIFTQVTTLTGLRLAVHATSADYVLTDTDFELICDATLGDIDVSLPPATGTGQIYHVKKIDATANVVSINADGSDLIDGSISVALVDEWSDAWVIDAAAGYWDQIST